MKQVYVVGGNYDHVEDFTKTINRNIKILLDGDKNAKIEDVKIDVHRDPRYDTYGMTYLAFIIAEVDVDEENLDYEMENESDDKKKKKSRWWK